MKSDCPVIVRYFHPAAARLLPAILNPPVATRLLSLHGAFLASGLPLAHRRLAKHKNRGCIVSLGADWPRESALAKIALGRALARRISDPGSFRNPPYTVPQKPTAPREMVAHATGSRPGGPCTAPFTQERFVLTAS